MDDVRTCAPLLCLCLLFAVAGCGETISPAPQPPVVAAATPAPSPSPAASASATSQLALASAPQVSRATVAVADFEGGSVPPNKNIDFWSTALAGFLIADLAESKNLQLVDRTHLAAILREQRLSMSNLSDPSTRLRIGKIVGAKYFIFGTYTIIGNQAALTARMDDVETGQIIKSSSVNGNAQHMPELAQQLAVSFLTPLDRIVAMRELNDSHSAGEPPQNARTFYEQGLALESSGKYDQAIDMYTHALTVFPHYLQAREHLESASEAVSRE
jgi:curli biogenesis system outer membrane secretion channel CsgG